jgi:hypothetical protein
MTLCQKPKHLETKYDADVGTPYRSQGSQCPAEIQLSPSEMSCGTIELGTTRFAPRMAKDPPPRALFNSFVDPPIDR